MGLKLTNLTRDGILPKEKLRKEKRQNLEQEKNNELKPTGYEIDRNPVEQEEARETKLRQKSVKISLPIQDTFFPCFYSFLL